MNDTSKVKLLGGDHWKSFFQVKPHLVAEHRYSSRSGSIVLLRPLIEDMLQQIMVLFHARNLRLT